MIPVLLRWGGESLNHRKIKVPLFPPWGLLPESEDIKRILMLWAELRPSLQLRCGTPNP